MDEIPEVTTDHVLEIVSNKGFDIDVAIKDFHLTKILYLIRDIKGMYFKGGTALNKIVLEYARLSVDLDYTCDRDLHELKKEIEARIGKTYPITNDKDVNGFIRIVAHYTDIYGLDSTVFIDLNSRAKIALPPESHKIHHMYQGIIPEFSVTTTAIKEMVAEKFAANIGRNKPRDLYDLFMIYEIGLPVDMELVKKKCHESGDEFDIQKMFSNARKLKNRWDEDMVPLLTEEVSFQEVIRVLNRHLKT